MNVRSLRQRLKTSGSHLIRTSDGNEYIVEHPEFVMVGRHNLVIETVDGLLDIVDPVEGVAISRGSPKPRKQNLH
jgi:hypothetical protein